MYIPNNYGISFLAFNLLLIVSRVAISVYGMGHQDAQLLQYQTLGILLNMSMSVSYKKIQ